MHYHYNETFFLFCSGTAHVPFLGVHDRDKIAERHRSRRAVGKTVSRVLRGFAAGARGSVSVGNRNAVAAAVVAGHAASVERDENPAAQ